MAVTITATMAAATTITLLVLARNNYYLPLS
jgi:hypothetical protein